MTAPTPPHVLVVGAGSAGADHLRSDLEAGGYRVSVAPDGASGYERFLADAPDVVLADTVLAGMDGYQLCRAVKSHPTLNSTPVVLLGSPADPAELPAADEAGADDFVGRPCDPAALRARLDAVRQARADLARSELHSLRSLAEGARQRLAAVLGAIPEAVLVIEGDGTVSHATAAADALLGRGPETVVGGSARDVLPLYDGLADEPVPLPPERHPVAQVLAGQRWAETGSAYGAWLSGPEGLWPVAVRATGVQGTTGSTTAAVAVVHDLRGWGLRDRATGLAGPDLFHDRVREALHQPGRAGQPAALILGLDRFESLREALPDGARAFLAATARRLETVVAGAGPDALAASLGGGEFGILLASVSPFTATAVGRRLVETLREPVMIDGDKLSSTVSVGLAAATEGSDGVRLLRTAGTALRQARRRGGDCVELADEGLRHAIVTRLRLAGELREAAAAGRLVLSYDPHIRLATGEVAAAEVCVAWPHPVRGTIGLDEFLPLAEECGIVATVGAWALAEACRTVRRWRRVLPGAESLQLAMTVPTRWLLTEEFPDQVGRALRDSGLPPEALVLNLAEGAAPSEAADPLHRLGVEVAAAGFGRRSSLQSHRHLGAQRLVLEPALVTAMRRDVGDAAFIAGAVRLAHGLGLQILATGVTDEEQVVSLRLMGCDLAAGPFLSAPRSPEDFERWWYGDPAARAGRAVPHRPRAASDALWAPAETTEISGGLRDEVLTYLAHELRNPLAVIAASAQLLDTDRDQIDPSLHELVDSLGYGATRISRIVDNLYDLRAAHLGTLRVEKSPRDLAADLRRILAETPGLAEREVRSRILASCTVTFDGQRVGQVLVNVLDNALKYTAPGTPIEVDLRRGDEAVEVAVRDHGPGIPDGRRHELFHKFARLGSPLPGSGLGLFLSRAIARAHGGDLVYERPDGPGARFVLTLPLH